MSNGLKPYPDVRPSGVPWLGDVPTHWEIIALGNLGSMFKGNGGSKEDETAAGVPCVRYGDLYTRHEFFIRASRSFVSEERAKAYTPIAFGDVLFAASGETIEDIGRSAVNLMTGGAVCGGDVIVLRPEGTVVEPEFLGYATNSFSSAWQKGCAGKGFTVVHLYATDLKRLCLAQPPLREQAAIVRFLSHNDRLIRRHIRIKQKLVTLLEEEKRAVIYRAVTRGLDPTIPLKPSGISWLGQIPAHWRAVRLRWFIRLLTGFPFKSAGFVADEGGGIRLLRGVNVTPRGIRWTNVVAWPAEDGAAFSAYALAKGDIVLGMDRPIVGSGTRTTVVGEQDLPALLLQRVARIRPRPGLSPDYLIALLKGPGFSNYLEPIFTGVSVPHLSPAQIGNFEIPLPPIEDQRAIIEWTTSMTKPLERTIDLLEREIMLLREYRARLVADVVTGKLDVREAAASLPEDLEVEPEDAKILDEVEDLADEFSEDELEEEVA